MEVAQKYQLILSRKFGVRNIIPLLYMPSPLLYAIYASNMVSHDNLKQ